MKQRFRPRPLAAALGALALSACVSDETDLDVTDEELVLTGPNCAMKSNEKGGLDTGVAVSSFFSGASGFTLSAWIMPEFVFADHQPVFGTVNTNFWVGAGNFRARRRNSLDCNYIPVLTVRIGSDTQHYLAPSFVRGTWRHLAMTYSPDGFGNGIARLYLDGVMLQPFQNGGETDPDEQTCGNVTDVLGGPLQQITPAELPGAPAGNLFIGRGYASRYFYGLVDHAIVQSTALTGAQVSALAQGGGPTAGTVVWQTGFTGRESCTGPIGTGTARRVDIGARDSGDAALFRDPALVAPTGTAYHLPFAPGEIWRVIQEPDSTGTHNGYAAFCWDFGKVGGSALEIVRAAAAGQMWDVKESEAPPADGSNESNRIFIVTGSGEKTSHLHLAQDSVSEIFFNGDPPMFLPQDGQFQVAVGGEDELARLGVNNSHLHFGIHPTAGSSWTSPMAFDDYQVAVDCQTQAEITVSTPGIASHPCWKTVTRGMPRDNTYLRRP